MLDLYCGLGGLSLGFELTDTFKTIGGIDNFAWAVRTFYHNHQIRPSLISEPQDMGTLEPERLLDALGERPEVIVGGPPCQGFSHAGRRLENLREDPRNQQVFHYSRLVRGLQPKVFVLENVSGMLKTGQSQKHELIESLIGAFAEMGYETAWSILNTAHYRVPQVRRRLIMVGVHQGERPFSFPEPPCSEQPSLFADPCATVSDALSDMPKPNGGQCIPYDLPPTTPLQKFLRTDSPGVWNHLDTAHSSEMRKRLAAQVVGTRLYANWNHSWYRLDPTRFRRQSRRIIERHSFIFQNQGPRHLGNALASKRYPTDLNCSDPKPHSSSWSECCPACFFSASRDSDCHSGFQGKAQATLVS